MSVTVNNSSRVLCLGLLAAVTAGCCSSSNPSDRRASGGDSGSSSASMASRGGASAEGGTTALSTGKGTPGTTSPVGGTTHVDTTLAQFVEGELSRHGWTNDGAIAGGLLHRQHGGHTRPICGVACNQTYVACQA